MKLYLEKFLHTTSGRYLMSVILGIGIASFFRIVCKGNDCIEFRAPPMDQIKDKIHKNGNKCYKYVASATTCNKSKKILHFSESMEI
jgi:hypothetical protein